MTPWEWTALGMTLALAFALGYLALGRRETFDLVLMDVQMPEMDGLEATAAIRAAERESGTDTCRSSR